LQRISLALPLRDARKEVLQLHFNNAKLRHVVETVATAKPNNALVQVLSPITQRSVQAGHQPARDQIRLAVELNAAPNLEEQATGILTLPSLFGCPEPFGASLRDTMIDDIAILVSAQVPSLVVDA